MPKRSRKGRARPGYATPASVRFQIVKPAHCLTANGATSNWKPRRRLAREIALVATIASWQGLCRALPHQRSKHEQRRHLCHSAHLRVGLAARRRVLKPAGTVGHDGKWRRVPRHLTRQHPGAEGYAPLEFGVSIQPHHTVQYHGKLTKPSREAQMREAQSDRQSGEIIMMWTSSIGTRCVLAFLGDVLQLRLEHDGKEVRRAHFTDIRRASEAAQRWRIDWDIEARSQQRWYFRTSCPNCGDDGLEERDVESGVQWFRCTSCGEVWPRAEAGEKSPRQ